MRLPSASLAVARMRTRLTFTRNVVGSWARAARVRASRLAARKSFGRTLIPFSFHPDFSVGEVFFLPDRDEALQAVDAFESGRERRLAMRGGDDDGYAG